MKIKEILTINLSEDIKNVIDLEDISEQEILSEIENYIVTDGLAKDYADFVGQYTSNKLETGVWISGFYGSGKSYFGKLLGYLLSNRMIMGTPARERILARFRGISDEALIVNELSGLNAINSRVVFLDIAKQDTSKGFSYTLFRNFLRSLELPENEHGFFLYHLLMNDKQTNIHEFVSHHLNKNWADIKPHLLQYARAGKDIFLSKGNSESDYHTLMTTIIEDIKRFGASRLKEEINKYLLLVKNERIVFLFDETSEAINQKKFGLLDLEGVSESLSSLGGRVWTIAIAQEKLDEVINNANVSKAQLTKVTDRFSTKIHLESTEVDVIIRNRLLKKTQQGRELLAAHFQKNPGKISDHAAINGAGISKTDNTENYTTYYPFYKYQFDLLQNFLFGTKGYASTKVAARGMIITTYDILKQEVQNNELFHTVTGWHIAKEGQPQPPIQLISRYDTANRILREAGSLISGRNLLETINFLKEAEVTPATLPNIVKSYIGNPDDFHQIQEEIAKALDLLTEAKVLLDTNKTYRITTDNEQRMLDEMLGYTVQGFVKKKQLVAAYKTANLTRNIARMTDNGLQFDFYITTDNDDELTTPNLKKLIVKIKSLYNFSDSRAADIETLKERHQNDKDLIWLLPDNSKFVEIDRLIDEVERISYLEQKYNDPNSEEGKILNSFLTAKGEKKKKITDLVEESLMNAMLIYLYDTHQLNKDNWPTTLQAQQKQVIQNVYSKKLASQLDEGIALTVIKEANNERLSQYFTKNDFAFFDRSGTFIGENLLVTEEILSKIRNTLVAGETLEKDLAQPPTGFAYGTVIASVAALMRAGKIIAKHNGAEKFSWRDDGVVNIFSTAREFRKATFKAVSKSLTASQKQDLAQFLLDIEVEKYLDKKKIDFNTNDFELVNAVRETAKHFTRMVNDLQNREKEFDKLFPSALEHASFLGNYTGAVSEANYIDKAVEFLANKDQFLKAVQGIEKVEKFIRNNLTKVKEWKSFVEAVADELTKAATTNPKVQLLKKEFELHYSGNVVSNFGSLQHTAQKIKDEYHQLFTAAMNDCSAKYAEIFQMSEALITEIHSLPSGINEEALRKANALNQYARQRKQAAIDIDYDVKDKHSRFTYSEVLSFIELYQSKKTEIDISRAGLIREKAPETQQGSAQESKIHKYVVKLPPSNTKVAAFKQWLMGELQKLASAADDDEIDIN